MTREEAKRILYVFRAVILVDESHIEAFEMAIKALEQEPCEDAISRQAMLNEIPVLWNNNGNKDYCMETLRDFVTELQPVTLQPKVGHWIRMKAYEKWGCSECHTVFRFSFIKEYDYCPNCGAKMVELKAESEE